MISAHAAAVVLDTNVALDLLVFADRSTQDLQSALAAGTLQWLATQQMRNEFERVLGYPRIVRYLQRSVLPAAEPLAHFDAMARLTRCAAAAGLRCRDPDDQIFIDLALAHGALLLSKDAAVLALRKRLAAAGVAVRRSMSLAA